ncbi:MAG: diaminopimelate epimerase [Lachnospiraceae bacterium]|nr:diaminopimelate epimerase [Lachnospiraceae bacterium]
MHFTKMQGCGNDYVVLDGRSISAMGGERGELAKKLCNRHYGIGSDGLLILQEGRRARLEMEMYNPDGSRAEMCGNGIRCAGKYFWEQGWTAEKRFLVECMERLVTVEYLKGEGRLARLSADMGQAWFEEKMVQGWKLYRVSMGNPHAVVLLEEGDDWPTQTAGPLLERAEEFPEGTNVEFVNVKDREHIEMRVWERGVGETLACGTGACAAAAVCMQKGLTDEEITVTLLGGELLVQRHPSTGRLILTGPAETVFEGEV